MIKNTNNNDNSEMDHSLVDTTTTTTATNSRYTTATDTSIIDTEEDDQESMTFPFSSYPLNNEQYITPTQILDIITSDIDNITLQQRLKTAIKEFSANYTTQYNTLIQSFNNVKSAHDDLLHELTIQQSHYDKAVREMRFYKTKYERLHQLYYQKQKQQSKTKTNCNNNNNMFLSDNDILDWQRRIASSSNNKNNTMILSPTPPRIKTRSQRNRSFASENNESYCGSSACSSAGDWSFSYTQNNIQNAPSFLPHTNTHPIYRHPTDNTNYNDYDNLLHQEENDTNHKEEDRIVDLMAVISMSDRQQEENINTNSTKSLPIELAGKRPSLPTPSISLPPPPSYPPPTRTVSSTATLKNRSSSSLHQEQQQDDNSTSNNSSSNKVLVDTAATEGNEETPIDPTTKNRTMSLIFACGDGFWDTIARGKNNKAEVDSLISNYLRRGGQPNVAKNSSSLKSVKEGYGLIHALIAVKNASALSRIIEAGANPNVIALAPEEMNRTTPLVLAGQLGYLTGIRLLLERARADIFQRGPRQMTALHAALEKGDDEVAIYLIRASKYALLDIVDVEGATPLHYACKYGRIKMMTMFIRDCHVKMDPIDNKGETPLHYAVRQRRLKMITRLIGDFGVYPNHYVLKQTPTPLDLAKSGGFKSISEYLKKSGAKTTKEMEKRAYRGSATTSSSTKSEKELTVQLSSTSSSTTTSHNSMNDNIPSNNSSGITTASNVVLGTRISFSSSNISGTTTSSSSSSRKSLANSLSGSASVHSSSNGSTISRGSVAFSLSRASMNFRNNLFAHY
ncbi:hypothetical protein BDC45DRAFT_540233 [Circinella umbellata]|nr:hypothetical protein BDC45DRAFT_540233 [Circinella umbellata]